MIDKFLCSFVESKTKLLFIKQAWGSVVFVLLQAQARRAKGLHFQVWDKLKVLAWIFRMSAILPALFKNKGSHPTIRQLLVPYSSHFSVLSWLAFPSVGWKINAVASEQNYIKTSNLLEFLICAV